MIETNIKIVRFGSKLRLDVRPAKVTTQAAVPELLEKACNALASRQHLSAVKESGGNSHILVLSGEPISKINLEEDNWYLDVEDAGSRRLNFSTSEDQFLMTQLLERSLLKQVSRNQSFWMLDSYRMFYEKAPFDKVQDVAAYRRFEIASVPIEGVGVGLIVDIGTAFFTNLTVADFFKEDHSEDESRYLRKRFNKLSQRQIGNKGTLLYEYKPGRFKKCYFDSFCPGVTASTTGKIRINNETFSSLQEYYQIKQNVRVEDDEPVAKVSFANILYPVFVAANKLRLRVMNDALPRQLKNSDKIAPQERHNMINRFWQGLGPNPLGKGNPQVERELWRPQQGKLFHAKAPDLLFSDGNVLRAPVNGHIGENKAFFSSRLSYLDKYGCFYVPPSAPRTLYVAVPREFEKATAEFLAESAVELVRHWTRMNTEVVWFQYDTQEGAIKRLKNGSSSGIVLFVFDDENPAAYFNIAYELSEWRIKRITKSKLAKISSEFAFATDAASGRTVVSECPSGWRSFIEMNVLDVLQQMDCVPWTLAEKPTFTARLGIDVGESHRFFALSLLIFQDNKSQPFRLDTDVENKNDSKRETINEVILQDKIVELCERAVKAGFANIDSLLILRDGRQCGKEIEAVEGARARLHEIGFLSKNPKTELVDFHKNSVKGIRIWNHGQDGRAGHAIEGTGINLNSNLVAIANTGAATLRQGTAEPVILESRNQNVNLVSIAKEMSKTCHLNWSNPRVAQKLPLELKRTDED